MKKPLLFILLLPLLSSCSGAQAQPQTIRWEQQMKNPLYAERYWDEMTERMADIQMTDKKAKNPSVIDEVRRTALAQAQQQTQLKHKGKLGQFVTVTEDTQGWLLLLDRLLYFSPDFVTYPGPSLRIYLSPSIDPRGATFPDKGSVELGRLESPYGAQQYLLPAVLKDLKPFRTVVLYDARIERIYAFAQLQ
jgi:hypothetical protein